MKNLEKALEIAFDAHRGQVDKAGLPYILHPLRLMIQLEDETDMISALLHDVLEDSNVTANDLKRHGIPPKAIETIVCLTRTKEESYEDFIKRAGTNQRARQIKILDLKDNLNISRMNTITDKDFDRLRKYHLAIKYLKKKSGVVFQK